MDKVFLLLFITLTSLLCSSSSQRCLESRLDFRPCHYKGDDPKLNIPNDNEYRVYFTKLRGPYCRIRKGKTVNEYKSYTAEIEDHETERIKIIDSPDYLRNENYSNQMLVYYNVKCDVGPEKIFFDILEMDLQGADCEYDPNTNVCEDYILIDRTQYGYDEFCGNNIPEISPKNLADGNVRITFRTSEKTRGKGFRMYVICYDQTKQNDKRKRNVCGGEPCFNVDEFNSKVCTNATIEKVNNTKYSITDVFSDPTYNPNCTKQSPRQIFLDQQRVQGRSCHKPTPPPIMYDLDPNNLPNKEEQEELTKMVTSFLSSVPDKRYQDDFVSINDTETLENITLSKPPDCIEISKIPRIVNESREIGNGGDNRTTLFAALRNQNACNPVLRAGANAILKFFRNNSEMESLKMFPIHCTEHSNLTVSCQSDYTTLPGRTQCKVDDKMCFNCEPFSAEPISVAEYKGKTMKVTAINCNGQRAEAVIQLNQ